MKRTTFDPTSTNGLVNRMSKASRESFADACEEVPLDFEAVIVRQGEPLEHVYFPLHGYISQVTKTTGAGLEIALTGNEGMFGLPASLHVPVSQVLAIVQGPGMALRMTARRFRLALGKSAPLQSQMNRFTFASLGQLGIAAECAKFHSVDQRLARWLLMTADRAHSKMFRMTHQFLAYMLGTRRVGITVAASKLQLQGVIRYSRGNLEILDFGRLNAASCSCYRNGVDAYDTAFGPNGRRTSDGPEVR